MENFNKKDYKKLWVNFESSTQAMDLLVILNNIEIFEISLITIESDVNNNVLDLMDNLDIIRKTNWRFVLVVRILQKRSFYLCTNKFKNWWRK